ncbi:hypothetical Protein YC6258_00298 [Gynuella sunshinyii YC6258]|uniref:Uncharacterized protein n=1 Tax=Gynuella sunshinyii YC6258 TaxID=1445510 RepID=A0A0C5VG25_9GAMM|nr:hypothetical Protein YC6258_00298 [Gynuella sunshinyii YC6258]
MNFAISREIFMGLFQPFCVAETNATVCRADNNQNFQSCRILY